MIRYAFCLPAFLSATLFALPLAAQTQATVSAPQNQSQLDRIEGKLDELLRRLDQPRPQPSGTIQGKVALECAPAGGQFYTAVLTVCRAC
jgi:hypothetical protein